MHVSYFPILPHLSSINELILIYIHIYSYNAYPGAAFHVCKKFSTSGFFSQNQQVKDIQCKWIYRFVTCNKVYVWSKY